MISKVYKIAIAGTGATGTASICRRYCSGEFFSEYTFTRQKLCTADIKTTAYEEPIRFLIWNRRTGGFYYLPENMAERFGQIKGLILVYDVTRKRTFEELPRWLDIAIQYASNFPVAIVGNKIDLAGEKTEERGYCIPSEQIVDPRTGLLFAESIADEYDVPTLFMETSAKTGHNIHRLFSEFAEIVAIHWRGNESD